MPASGEEHGGDGFIQEISLSSPREPDWSRSPCSLRHASPHAWAATSPLAGSMDASPRSSRGEHCRSDNCAQVRWLCARDAALTRLVEELSQKVKALEASIDARFHEFAVTSEEVSMAAAVKAYEGLEFMMQEETENREYAIAVLKGEIVERIQSEVAERVAVVSAEVQHIAMSVSVSSELGQLAASLTGAFGRPEDPRADSDYDMASVDSDADDPLGPVPCDGSAPLWRPFSPLPSLQPPPPRLPQPPPLEVPPPSTALRPEDFGAGDLAAGSAMGSAFPGDGRSSAGESCAHAPGLTRLPLAVSFALPAAATERFDGFMEARSPAPPVGRKHTRDANTPEEVEACSPVLSRDWSRPTSPQEEADLERLEIACLAVAFEKLLPKD